jgi:hypothetical protein
VCEIVIALQLLVVMSCKCPISLVTNTDQKKSIVTLIHDSLVSEVVGLETSLEGHSNI